LSEGRVLI